MLPIMLRVWPSLKTLYVVLQWYQDEIIIDVSQFEEFIVH